MAGLIEMLTTQTYFGNTLLQFLLFLATVGVVILAAKILSYIVKGRLRSIAKKTRTGIDDFAIDIIEQPLWMVALIIGMAFGANFLSFTEASALVFQNTLNVIGVLVIAWIAVKSVDAFITVFLEPVIAKTGNKMDDQLLPLISKISKVIVAFLAFIVIVSGFGYDVTAVLAGLGIGGLAFAFAAQETIADMFGGFSIFTSKPFVVGDFIEVEGIVGGVEEVGLRHTRVRNLEKRLVTLPNSKVANSIITNVSTAPQRKCVWHLGLTYGTSVAKLEKAKKIILDAIASHPECAPDPLVQFEEFGDFSLKILVLFFTNSNDWAAFMKTKNDVGLKIKREFEKAKIEFAFPTQTVHVRK
ncbi:MAG: mechanosensitive ion channel family protein [Candidatus Diapherotrites archaeon]|uniref:Mechanosensitive ion channel family protein n=1 Tax=Candidatus Iainarchaeum sp. TaxID=3101447 RepID=A0A938YPL9_9ARCH|nr:mechanosensitive ion channel family protein [Candidatus Diapherotrites archaeon]